MSLKLFLYRKKEAMKRSIERGRYGYCNVLLYHRVNDLEYDPQQLCVSQQNFEQQLTSLKKDHHFLTLDEFCDILTTQKKFPKNSLLVTFDDGYADNYQNALPVLESLGLQAVFYVATATLNTHDLFWWDELDLIFRDIEPGLLIDLQNKYKLDNSTELYKFYLTSCKNASSLEERSGYINELRAKHTVAPGIAGDYRSLTFDELIQFSASKSTVIGAHTVNHLALSCLTEDVQRNEISASVKILSNILKRDIKHFSFPYGEKSHYNDDTIRICKDLKLKSAAANYYNYTRPVDDIFSFPRVVVRNDSALVLREKLKQLAS